MHIHCDECDNYASFEKLKEKHNSILFDGIFYVKSYIKLSKKINNISRLSRNFDKVSDERVNKRHISIKSSFTIRDQRDRIYSKEELDYYNISIFKTSIVELIDDNNDIDIIEILGSERSSSRLKVGFDIDLTLYRSIFIIVIIKYFYHPFFIDYKFELCLDNRYSISKISIAIDYF